MRVALLLLGSLVCFLCGGVANAQSPSFDCSKARLADEFAICRSSQLAELDNLVSAGYAFLKSTQGRPAADQVGIPFWRLRQSCQSDEACIRQRQIQAIKAYHAAGAPVTLPSWASLQVYGSNSGAALKTLKLRLSHQRRAVARGLAILPFKWSATAGHLRYRSASTVS
jgi:uncharacterized protein